MIKVTVILSQEGVIAELVAEGHALAGRPGKDLVCAAFTLLLRTFARSVEAAPALTWTLRGDDADQFNLAVSGVAAGMAEQYRGWCGFFLRGLEDLQGDAPGSVRIQYGNTSGRLFHGS